MNKQTLVIAEPSPMLRNGFAQFANQLNFIDRVIELDVEESLAEQVMDYDPNIIIVNPILLGTAINPRQILGLKKETHLAALVHTLYSTQYLQGFNVVININDSQDIVNEKLKGLSNTKKSTDSENEELSDREQEILVTLVKGLSNKEIADHHNISIHTVITHRRNITRKLNIHSLSGLTVYAIVNNLVDINDIQL